MTDEFPLARSEIESLMRRLKIPEDEIPSDVHGTGLWLLHRWRASGYFCCINVFSDYSYRWDVSWSYSEVSKLNNAHLHFQISEAFHDFDEAIYVSAAQALGAQKGGFLVSKRTHSIKHQPQSVIDSLQEQIADFFESIESRFVE